MGNLQNAGAGLKKMYIASIGSIVCTILSAGSIMQNVASIGAIVFIVLCMVGLYGTGKDIEECKTAFTLMIVSLIVSVIGAYFRIGIMSMIITITGYIISFMVTYLVCISVGKVMNQMGATDVAQRGEAAWKSNAVCYAVMILLVIIGKIPILGWLTGMAGRIVILLLSLIAGILYTLFLGKSSQVLGA